MSRDNDLLDGEVKAAESTMVCWITEENVQGGSRLKFMSGVMTREAEVAKHTEVVVCRVALKKTIVRSIIKDRYEG